MALKIWIDNGLPYVDEDALALYDCGCGNKPLFDFIFDYRNNKFICAQVRCTKCGMNTGSYKNPEKAIEIWQNAFETDHYHKEYCRFNDDDICLGGFHGDDD
jgi:hypothetical protein